MRPATPTTNVRFLLQVFAKKTINAADRSAPVDYSHARRVVEMFGLEVIPRLNDAVLA